MCQESFFLTEMILITMRPRLVCCRRFFGDGEASYTQRSAREIAHRAVGFEAVIFLKLTNACVGLTTEYTIHFQRC